MRRSSPSAPRFACLIDSDSPGTRKTNHGCICATILTEESPGIYRGFLVLCMIGSKDMSPVALAPPPEPARGVVRVRRHLGAGEAVHLDVSRRESNQALTTTQNAEVGIHKLQGCSEPATLDLNLFSVAALSGQKHDLATR
jgi:hypothetical protein